MSSPSLEAFLARLYVDPLIRSKFIAEPKTVAAQAGLGEAECRELENIDWVGLAMASHSFERKRDMKENFLIAKRSRGPMPLLNALSNQISNLLRRKSRQISIS